MRSSLKHSLNYKHWLLLALLALSNLGGDSEMDEGFELPPPPDCEDCGADSTLMVFTIGTRILQDGVVVLTEEEASNEKEVEASLEGIDDPSDWSLEWGGLPVEGFLESVELAPSFGVTATISIEGADPMPIARKMGAESPPTWPSRKGFDTRVRVVAEPSTGEEGIQKRYLRIEAKTPRIHRIGRRDAIRNSVTIRPGTSSLVEVEVQDSAVSWEISLQDEGPSIASFQGRPPFPRNRDFSLRIKDTLDWTSSGLLSSLVRSFRCDAKDIIFMEATDSNNRTIRNPLIISLQANRGEAGCPAPEICDDSQDNDGDGLTDCLDPDCPFCPEICDDGVDNDRDRLIDCKDPDCQVACK